MLSLLSRAERRESLNALAVLWAVHWLAGVHHGLFCNAKRNFFSGLINTTSKNPENSHELSENDMHISWHFRKVEPIHAFINKVGPSMYLLEIIKCVQPLKLRSYV